MGLPLNTQPQMQLPFKLCTIPRNRGKTKMACGLLKDYAEEMKNPRKMKWTLLNQETV